MVSRSETLPEDSISRIRSSEKPQSRAEVVVMAPADEQILLALQLWAGAAEATLAPLSAVIRRQNGGDAVPEPEAAETAEAAETPETDAAASSPAN